MVDKSIENYEEEIIKIGTGTSVQIKGTVVKSLGGLQKFEL